MSTEESLFDYVVVGAGAAGCVLANRLAAEGAHSVCLLEAGPRDNSIFLRIPAGVYKVSSDPKYTWMFETEPGPLTAGRSIPMPQGKTLGGSTAINGMNYNRGNANDFDDWAARGNRGWAFADVLPYFKRTERRIGPFDARYRGADGDLPITDCDWHHPLCDAFIDGAVKLGLPRNPDYNGETQRGVGYYQRYIENGWRMSAARAFLRPIAKRPNVEIRTNAQATAILLDGKRTVGIKYVHAPGARDRVVKARREVILCCGAANTPKLLEISGIGAGKQVGDLGVALQHELPGVGQNLQDHYMVHLVARVKGIKTISGRGVSLLREAAKWALGYPSIMAISPSLVYGFVNSKDLCSTPDIQLDLAIGNYTNPLLERFPVIKLGFYQLRPKSTGFVHARSADPFRAPVIQPCYLLDDQDQQVAIDGTRAVRRLLATPELRPYYDAEELPGASAVDDAAYLDYARNAGLTAYHLCGSCRMGPRSDPTAVVDDELRVYGLAGLRIADASIMPSVLSANISAAVFMIAEKAADLILGRPCVSAPKADPVAGRPRRSKLASAA